MLTNGPGNTSQDQSQKANQGQNGCNSNTGQFKPNFPLNNRNFGNNMGYGNSRPFGPPGNPVAAFWGQEFPGAYYRQDPGMFYPPPSDEEASYSYSG